MRLLLVTILISVVSGGEGKSKRQVFSPFRGNQQQQQQQVFYFPQEAAAAQSNPNFFNPSQVEEQLTSPQAVYNNYRHNTDQFNQAAAQLFQSQPQNYLPSAQARVPYFGNGVVNPVQLNSVVQHGLGYLRNNQFPSAQNNYYVPQTASAQQQQQQLNQNGPVVFHPQQSQFPQNQISHNQFSQNQFQQNQISQNQFPKIQFQQNQFPQNQFPQYQFQPPTVTPRPPSRTTVFKWPIPRITTHLPSSTEPKINQPSSQITHFPQVTTPLPHIPKGTSVPQPTPFSYFQKHDQTPIRKPEEQKNSSGEEENDHSSLQEDSSNESEENSNYDNDSYEDDNDDPKQFKPSLYAGKYIFNKDNQDSKSEEEEEDEDEDRSASHAQYTRPNSKHKCKSYQLDAAANEPKFQYLRPQAKSNSSHKAPPAVESKKYEEKWMVTKSSQSGH